MNSKTEKEAFANLQCMSLLQNTRAREWIFGDGFHGFYEGNTTIQMKLELRETGQDAEQSLKRSARVDAKDSRVCVLRRSSSAEKVVSTVALSGCADPQKRQEHA